MKILFAVGLVYAWLWLNRNLFQFRDDYGPYDSMNVYRDRWEDR